ncbi:MAG: hypothetical protein EXS01_05970 [Phycisphaerales bacterium]|nr:hypothetical protein [Phycisphaerales bacterium]
MSARVATPARAAALTRILGQVSCFPELRFDARSPRPAREVRAAIGVGGDQSGDSDVRESAQIDESSQGELPAPSGGLAGAIEFATLRHWLTAESIARVMCTRPWLEVQPEVRAALLVGATQIFFMPREPVHAVVDDCVSWTRGRLQAGAGGFVNALLRRIAGLRGVLLPASDKTAWWEMADAIPLPDGTVLKLNEPVFSADPIARLSAQTSHPMALIARWSGARGMATARTLAAHNLVQMPIVIHSGSGRSIGDDPMLAEHSVRHSHEGFAVWTGSTGDLARALQARSDLIVQDPASARAVDSTRDLSPKRILDACAGRGTKAVQCAMRHPNAEVWATDPDLQRLDTLRARAKPFANLRVVELAELGRLPRYFDLVILDVPCSNTGVLARRLEARYRFTDRNLDELTRLQRGIADHHRGLCAPGGTLIWSTCSLDKAENQDQVRWLAKQSGGRVVGDEEFLPQGAPGDPPSECTDGAYHARIAIA